MNEKSKIVIGIISDTHGTLSKHAIDALKGADFILNAGDSEKIEIIERLSDIAPVTSVRGNMDYQKWAESINKTETITIGEKTFHILHNLNDLELDPEIEGIDVIISGHTHCPEIHEKNNVFYLNPGSASKKRYHYPHSVAKIVIGNKSTIEIIPIDDP
ncbi:MAG: YfcE family phosphodiesterase [Desulfobacterales bacterium]|nr:YfcE family phosphodiesterase [Desulfobacterales bacterium]MCP4160739.1 YfcE family phosphodiesterase [Deltaproteobacteria bacterium]